MPRLYDYIDEQGRNLFKDWTRGLQKHELTKLNQKLDMLERNGADLSTGLLSDTPSPCIKKIRINGPVACRPLLCRGPIDMQHEFTLLVGAFEKDRRLPKVDIAAAEECRNEIIRNQFRRRKHERVEWNA